jgi:hypothetical protein
MNENRELINLLEQMVADSYSFMFILITNHKQTALSSDTL